MTNLPTRAQALRNAVRCAEHAESLLTGSQGVHCARAWADLAQAWAAIAAQLPAAAWEGPYIPVVPLEVAP